MVKVEVLLDGQPVRTLQGIVGFCTVVLVEGEQRTLVDVGHVGRRNVLKAAIERRGLTADDIDNVLVTHLHWDHAQNLDVFPDARILVHPLERAYAGKPHRNDWATPAWSGVMLEIQRRIEEIEEGDEIEPGVRVLHTPGHSVGSICVSAETGEGLAVVSGDVLHYSSAALTRRNPTVFWSEEQASQSIDRIVEMADVIYPGHDRPFRVVDGEIEYLKPFELTLSGVAPDTEGLSFDTTPFPGYVMPGIEEQSL